MLNIWNTVTLISLPTPGTIVSFIIQSPAIPGLYLSDSGYSLEFCSSYILYTCLTVAPVCISWMRWEDPTEIHLLRAALPYPCRPTSTDNNPPHKALLKNDTKLALNMIFWHYCPLPPPPKKKGWSTVISNKVCFFSSYLLQYKNAV